MTSIWYDASANIFFKINDQQQTQGSVVKFCETENGEYDYK